MTCNRNICGQSGNNCADSADDLISLNDDFRHYVKHLKCRVTNLINQQIQKNMSKSRKINHTSIGDSNESIYSSPGEILAPPTKIDKKYQSDKIHSTMSDKKKSPQSTPQKKSRFNDTQHTVGELTTVESENLSDSGLGTTRFTTEYTLPTADDSTLSTLDHSTPLSSIELTDADFSSNLIRPNEISEINETVEPSTTPLLPPPLPPPLPSSSSRTPDTVGKYVDKALPATRTRTTDLISAETPPNTWSQRFVAVGNHVRRRFYERIHACMAALIVGVLVWMALIYGALLGATLCNYGRLPFYPGSSLHTKPPVVF